MAKLAEILSNKLIPTQFEEIYITDVTLEKVKEMTDLEKEVSDSEETEAGFKLMAWMFNEVIRAEDGTKFEDMLELESIKQNLGIVNAKKIMDAVMQAMTDTGNV